VGLARTGAATAQFLLRRGAKVKVSEAKPAAELAEALVSLQGLPLEWELGRHTGSFFADADLIVMSPRVPMALPAMQEARAKGVPVISEVELAFRFLRRPLIAITGTNGKTTTTTLIGEMLRASGKKVFVGGNIGTPLIGYIEGPQDDEWVVAEISSFQLEGVVEFRPKVSLLLNVTEDHLDRYDSFDAYIAAKARIFANQKRGLRPAQRRRPHLPQAFPADGAPGYPLQLPSPRILRIVPDAGGDFLQRIERDAGPV